MNHLHNGSPSLEYLNPNLVPLKPKVRSGPFPGRAGSVVVDTHAHKQGFFVMNGYPNSQERLNHGTLSAVPSSPDSPIGSIRNLQGNSIRQQIGR